MISSLTLVLCTYVFTISAPVASLCALLAIPVISVSLSIDGTFKVILLLRSVVILEPRCSPLASFIANVIGVFNLSVLAAKVAVSALPRNVGAVTIPGNDVLPFSSNKVAIWLGIPVELLSAVYVTTFLVSSVPYLNLPCVDGNSASITLSSVVTLLIIGVFPFTALVILSSKSRVIFSISVRILHISVSTLSNLVANCPSAAVSVL